MCVIIAQIISVNVEIFLVIFVGQNKYFISFQKYYFSIYADNVEHGYLSHYYRSVPKAESVGLLE